MRPAGTRARTHWKSPVPNAPTSAGPVPVRVAAGIPACPSHASIIEGLSPGRTTTRTSTTPSADVPGRTFHAGSYGPTQSTYGTADAPSRSDSRPRTTNPFCGTYRRSEISRDASSPCHAALIGATRWITPTAIPSESTDHGPD